MNIVKFQINGRHNQFNYDNTNILVVECGSDVRVSWSFDAGNSPADNEDFCREIQQFVENATRKSEIEELLGKGQFAWKMRGDSDNYYHLVNPGRGYKWQVKVDYSWIRDNRF